MATIKVKYKAMDFRGKSRTKTITHECPDFKLKDKVSTSKIVGFDDFPDKAKEFFQKPISIEVQQEEWLTDLDKRSIMDQYNWERIFDWEIVRKDSKEIQPAKQTDVIEYFEEIIRFDRSHEESTMSDDYAQRIKDDFMATYIEMKDSLKGLSMFKQVEIIFASMSVGHKAAGVAYQRITDILTTPSDKEKSKAIQRIESAEAKGFDMTNERQKWID